MHPIVELYQVAALHLKFYKERVVTAVELQVHHAFPMQWRRMMSNLEKL
jgi:hypothetical protein